MRIDIVDYDSRWADEFTRHANQIADALGDVAVRIEHIGSTSVPGLEAKPIIDILVVVRDSADEASYLPRLEAVGYDLRAREPDFHEHRMLKTASQDVHVHVFSDRCIEIKRYLAFRDRLRENPDERRLYEETKRGLAEQDWANMDAYAEAKSELIESILGRSG